MRGLLQLVEIVAKIKAINQLREKEELRCPGEPSPLPTCPLTKNLWLCLPHVKRQHLITVLSHMLENHLSKLMGI